VTIDSDKFPHRTKTKFARNLRLLPPLRPRAGLESLPDDPALKQAALEVTAVVTIVALRALRGTHPTILANTLTTETEGDGEGEKILPPHKNL
jgi:hypothetical protein